MNRTPEQYVPQAESEGSTKPEKVEDQSEGSRKEDLLEVPQESLDEAQREQQSLLDEQNRGIEEVTRQAEGLGFSQERTSQLLQESGTSAALEEIKGRGTSLFQRFHRGLEKAAVLGLGIFQLSGSPEVSAAQHLAQAETSAEQRTSARPERQEKQKGVVREQDLPNLTLFERRERMLVTTNLYQPGTYADISRAYVEGSFVYSDVKKLQKILNQKGLQSITLAHTHPLQVYEQFGVSEQQIEAIRQGKEKLPLAAPPSVPDVIEAVKSQVFLKSKGLEAKNAVLGTTGMWEFTVDTSHPFIRKLEQLGRAQQEFTDSFWRDLSEKEKQLLKSKKLDQVPPWEVAEVLEEDSKTEHLAEKIDALVKKFEKIYASEKKDLLLFDAYMGDLADAGTLGFSEAESDQLMKDYIAFCRDHGIEMNYRPYNLASKR